MRLGVRALSLLCLVALALGLTGCGRHLVGTHDVALDYEYAETPPGAVDPLFVAEVVRVRIAYLGLGATVTATAPDHVHVVVDASFAPLADDVAMWRGGLLAFLIDPAAK